VSKTEIALVSRGCCPYCGSQAFSVEAFLFLPERIQFRMVCRVECKKRFYVNYTPHNVVEQGTFTESNNE
jgi:hypothetical protein